MDLIQVEALSAEMFWDNFHIEVDYAGTKTGIIGAEIKNYLNQWIKIYWLFFSFPQMREKDNFPD